MIEEPFVNLHETALRLLVPWSDEGCPEHPHSNGPYNPP